MITANVSITAEHRINIYPLQEFTAEEVKKMIEDSEVKIISTQEVRGCNKMLFNTRLQKKVAEVYKQEETASDSVYGNVIDATILPE